MNALSGYRDHASRRNAAAPQPSFIGAMRFEDHEMAKLDELAARYHVSLATILRWAPKAMAEYVELNGGRILLPLDFTNFRPPVARYPGANEEAKAKKQLLVADKPKRPSY